MQQSDCSLLSTTARLTTGVTFHGQFISNKRTAKLTSHTHEISGKKNSPKLTTKLYLICPKKTFLGKNRRHMKLHQKKPFGTERGKECQANVEN
jgi:hypothetical protein